MLGKTLLNLDQIGEALDPKFDPNASIRRNAAEIMRARLLKSASPGNLFSSILEMKEFVERLPGRVNKILDVVASNQLQVKVDAIDETRLMTGFQKVANRITMGLVLAALIVGAAMLVRVETSFRILGYPGLALILFLLAAGGAYRAFLLTIPHQGRMTSCDCSFPAFGHGNFFFGKRLVENSPEDDQTRLQPPPVSCLAGGARPAEEPPHVSRD